MSLGVGGAGSSRTLAWIGLWVYVCVCREPPTMARTVGGDAGSLAAAAPSQAFTMEA